mgnify:CR=1 FL=1
MVNYALNVNTGETYDIEQLTELLINDSDRGENLIQQLYLHAEEVLDGGLKIVYSYDRRNVKTIQQIIMAVAHSLPPTEVKLSNSQILVLAHGIDSSFLHQLSHQTQPSSNEGGSKPRRNNVVAAVAPVSHLSQEDRDRSSGITPLHLDMNVETCVNILEAMKLIVKKFSSGRILICGSLYLAGQVLKDDGFKIK